MASKACTECGIKKHHRCFDTVGAFEYSHNVCKECVRLKNVGEQRKVANDEPVDKATKKAWAKLRAQTKAALNGKV